MNVSLNWLKKYIDLDLDPDKISEILTTIGLEVEGMKEIESVKGGLRGVVVGHVTECGKHPNADKLSLTKVNIGGEEDVQIVCGAPNVAQGQKVLVATIGTTLYSPEGEPWKIKKGKIRGEESHGMICAEDELGLGASHDGIMILPEEVKVGTLASDYFKIENDYVYDIGLTPNRSDATSHIGVAQDVAAYLSIHHGGDGSVKLPDLSSFTVDNNTKVVEVSIEDSMRCPRYSGISISDVTIKESPDWLKNNLNAIGVRPISNIVDITNYILHEYGQPLHAFDADKISNNSIKVKTLANGTTFNSLDEQERKLHHEDLMICDGENKGMCIAGVFGGIESGVTDGTKNIFLESAHFNASSIRKTSTRHLLRTDAAKVFEKGSDPNVSIDALKRASILIKELAGGTITSEIVDVYPEKIQPEEIQLRYDRVNELIGNDISVDEIHAILRAMNMSINPVDDNSIRVGVPTNKSDVTREVDLIEEILRIYGFNKIVTPSKIHSTLTYSNYPNKKTIKDRLTNYLSSRGFNEMMNLSLIESKLYEGWDSLSTDNFVYINNTSNIHLDIMRPEMALSGLQSVAHNINRQQTDLKLYEFGKSYKKEGEEFIETEKLTIFLTGMEARESWKTSASSADFYLLKESVENALELVNVSGYQTSESEDDRLDYGLQLHRGPQVIAHMGVLSDAVASRVGVKQEVYFAELDIATLIKAIGKSNFVQEISKFPSMRRDLALVLDESVKFDEVLKIAKKTDKKILKEVGLFDIFKSKEKLGEGKKSYAVSFLFENLAKTLSDKEVDKIMNKMQSSFERELNAVIRK
jgi:phenylalanyl-tRNA synthetase beta chain